MTVCTDREAALHAMLDGELDAMAQIALEAHLRSCPGCAAELDHLERLRAMLGNPALRDSAPDHLRHRILAQTGAASSGRPRAPASWRAWSGGALAGAMAASLALMIAVPRVAEPTLTDELVDSHIRSLQAAHLTDVATSNRHVVKPWFNGRIDYSPPVVDLVAQGFPLVGGRLDVIDQHTVAVLVYRRRLHRINLFIRPGPAIPVLKSAVSHDSYNLVRWTAGGLEYWAVSDLDAHEMAEFRQLFIGATKG